MAKARKPSGKRGRKGKRFSFTVPYMFGGQRVTIETEERLITPEEAADMLRRNKPGTGALPPVDEHLVTLVADARTGKVPVAAWCVAVADLAVHDPPTVERVRATYLEEPAEATIQLEVHSRVPRLWLVYRRADGRLVLFDDYAVYTASLGAGLADFPVAPVQVLGESADDLARTEAAAGCGLCAAEAVEDEDLAQARFLARVVARRRAGCPWDAGLCDLHRETVRKGS